MIMVNINMFEFQFVWFDRQQAVWTGLNEWSWGVFSFGLLESFRDLQN